MAKYHVQTDGGTFEVETDEPSAPASVPGMEKLGSQPPAPPAPPNPMADKSGVNFAGSALRLGHNLSTLGGFGEQPAPDGATRPIKTSSGIQPMPLLPEIPNPVDGIIHAAGHVAHAIMHPKETFLEDPIGTTSAVTGGLQNGLNLIRGASRIAPGIAEGAREAAPSLIKKIPYVGPVAADFQAGFKRGMAKGAEPPTTEAPAPMATPSKVQPISTPTPEPSAPAPPEAATIVPPKQPPSIDTGLANLRSKIEAKGHLEPGLHLGEVRPGANPERFDEGGPSPTIASVKPKTTILKEPAGGSPLVGNPKALAAAEEMAKAMRKK